MSVGGGFKVGYLFSKSYLICDPFVSQIFKMASAAMPACAARYWWGAGALASPGKFKILLCFPYQQFYTWSMA